MAVPSLTPDFSFRLLPPLLASYIHAAIAFEDTDSTNAWQVKS